jgi:hypothetical protein
VTSVDRSMADRRPDRSKESVLRAKHLDFCSAKVAEALLSLSPDEMYLLAEEAARTTVTPPASHLGYDAMVRLATEHLADRLDLPTFEQFRDAYRKDPAAFDRELLGLWETELRAPGSRSE